MAAGKGKWIRVSKASPCVACASTDWCTISADGTLARCMRVESDRESPSRDGAVAWLHQVKDDPTRSRRAPKPDNKPIPKIEDVPGLALSMARHTGADAKRVEMARVLGVSEQVLREMHVGIGWGPNEPKREFASFPSRDGDGVVVGITRRFADGRKLTFPGTSNSGLFLGSGWWYRFGPVFVVEGPSDTAAMLSANLCAIGRPSNVGVQRPPKSVRWNHGGSTGRDTAGAKSGRRRSREASDASPVR